MFLFVFCIFLLFFLFVCFIFIFSVSVLLPNFLYSSYIIFIFGKKLKYKCFVFFNFLPFVLVAFNCLHFNCSYPCLFSFSFNFLYYFLFLSLSHFFHHHFLDFWPLSSFLYTFLKAFFFLVEFLFSFITHLYSITFPFLLRFSLHFSELFV
jgi:hypothetical protein